MLKGCRDAYFIGKKRTTIIEVECISNSLTNKLLFNWWWKLRIIQISY